jgi:hypothetical protein
VTAPRGRATMGFMRIALILALALLLPGASCESHPVPPPSPVGGAAPIVDPWGGAGGARPWDSCDHAGYRLCQLGCRECTTPKGTPFAVTCRDSAADGRPYPVACITVATSCEQAEECQ